MSDRLAAVGLRVLAPCAVLLGTGDGEALQNIDTTELPDGSFCWVTDQTSFYVLHRSSTASPSGTVVVLPASGPGRWIILGSGASGSQIVVPNIAALELLPAPSNGESAYVLTLRTSWSFETASALVADGITVVADSGATGKWVRSVVPDRSWAYQAGWFIDATAGNDENLGDTSLAPLKTAAELSRRINGQTLQQTTTVSQMTDLAEYVNVTVKLAAPADNFLWEADPSALTTVFTGSGGLTAVTAINPSTNTPLSITDAATAGLNWANWLGAFRIRITTAGPRQNAVGYVAKVLSATQARTTPFTVFVPGTTNPTLLANVTPLNGDQYVVETLPGVLGMRLFIDRPGTNVTLLNVGGVDSIDLGKGSSPDSANWIDCAFGSSLVCVSRCIHESGRVSGFNCAVAATLFTNNLAAIADVFFITAGGAVLPFSFGVGQKIPFVAVQGDFLLNGGASFIPENTVTLGGSITGGVGIFDATNAGLFMHEEQDSTIVTCNDSGNANALLYGSGNALGVDMCGGHQLNYEILAPKITGTGGDIRIGLDIFSWIQTPVTNTIQLAGITNRQGINCASIYRTALGVAFGDTNVFTSTPAKGLYQITIYMAVTTAGAAGDQASVTLKWTDDSQAETAVVLNAVSVAAKGFFTVAQFVETNGAAAVTYALSFPVKTGAPQVSLRVVATPLQSANV